MKEYPQLLIADENKNVFEVPYLRACGMKAGEYLALEAKELIKLPSDSELFMLPDRSPVGFDPETQEFVALETDPYSDGSDTCFAVCAFLAPGYTSTINAAYQERKKSEMLPLFCYTAVCLYKGEFYAASVRVDKEKRQALAGAPIKKVEKGVKDFRNIFPENRLVRHLEKCALCYGCPAAKNFFLSRYEAPLPTSPGCNSKCLGCISHQPDSKCPVTQERIEFVPNPVEISEVACYHIAKASDPVVSFGQGCEGEPLMQADVLIEAVRLIRNKTSKGIINLNTNASKPEKIKGLLDAGLNSIRVSMNSMQKKYYDAYYRPVDYTFNDVVKSIRLARKAGAHVSINYLVMPGFTDSKNEVKTLLKFIETNDISMIQWRNLNYDPLRYFDDVGASRETPCTNLIGIKQVIKTVKREFPDVMHGYFNPARGRMRRFENSSR